MGRPRLRTILERGYSVRAAVRSEEKGEVVKKLFKEKLPERAEHLEYVVVRDIMDEHAYDDAVKGVVGVIHIASPMSIAIEDPQELIRPAVSGTIGLLGSAAHYGTDLKRIVLTSSVFAVLGLETRTYTEEDWADYAVKEVEEKGKNAHKPHMYAASKVLAERAAWEFYAKHRNNLPWDLTVLNPGWVYGPTVDDPASPSALPSTMGLFYHQFFTVRDDAFIYPSEQYYIDVRDFAEASISALEIREAGGERFLITSEWCTWQHWLNTAATLNLVPKLEKGSPQRAQNAPIAVSSSDKAKRVLGLRVKTITETLTDILDDFSARGWLGGY